MPGRVHISEKTLASLEENYTIEDGKGIERAENDGGGTLKTYFIVNRKSGASYFKPWRTEDDKVKSSQSSLHEAPPHRNDSLANVLEGIKSKHNGKLERLADPETVRLDGVNTSGDDDLEKTYLAKETSLSMSPKFSSSKGQQKQLAKAPLPFPKPSATFNFTYGITLNEALRRDAMRASNDNQLVKLMQEKKIQKEYFFNPPLNMWYLNFKDPPKPAKEEENSKDIEMTSYQNNVNDKKEKQQSTESKYREEGFKGFKLNPKILTFASPKVHFMFDVITCAVTLIITIIAGVMLFHPHLGSLPGFIVAIVICLLAMVGLLAYHCVKFSPSRFPKRISKCAAPMEISETGMLLFKENVLDSIQAFLNL